MPQQASRSPERAAEAREQHAFGEKLANDAQVAGAQSRANGKFARAAHGARQKKIGDIGAGNQQQETDGGEQQEEEWLDIADDVFLHGNDGDAKVFVGLRICGREILRDAIHVGPRLRERNARLKAADARAR